MKNACLVAVMLFIAWLFWTFGLIPETVETAETTYSQPEATYPAQATILDSAYEDENGNARISVKPKSARTPVEVALPKTCGDTLDTYSEVTIIMADKDSPGSLTIKCKTESPEWIY